MHAKLHVLRATCAVYIRTKQDFREPFYTNVTLPPRRLYMAFDRFIYYAVNSKFQFLKKRLQTRYQAISQPVQHLAIAHIRYWQSYKWAARLSPQVDMLVWFE